MNVFNRIIMTIAMLCLIVFSIVAIVNVFVSLFEWSTISDRITGYATNLNPYILAGILFLVLIIALIILISEFYRRKINLANISTDQSGKTMVTLKTSAQQIRESLNNIQGVIDPQVKVVPRQNGIIIDIFSKLITGINAVDKTKEIREAATVSFSLSFTNQFYHKQKKPNLWTFLKLAERTGQDPLSPYNSTNPSSHIKAK